VNHPLRSSFLSVASVVVIGLVATPVLAQDAAPAPEASPAAGPPVQTAEVSAKDDTGLDREQFCRRSWFAVGRCGERPWSGPVFVFGLDVGTSAMNEGGPFAFNSGVGSVTGAGPAWGLRAGVELLRWLALEGHYVGMYNSTESSVSPAGGVGYFTTGVDALVRFTAPLPYVHPYVLAGVGYYDHSLMGSSTAKAGSVMTSSTQPDIPMGVGVDVPLTWHMSLGAEATYHFAIHESYSAVTANGIDGGDVSTFAAVMRFRL
jgi:hypothetical protein